MEYAQLNKDGKDAIQITSHGLIEWDDQNYCTAEALVKDGKADQFRVVPLIATDPPEIDPLTQSCVRDGCEKVKGKWQYKWRIDALSQEQIAANLAEIKANTIARYEKALDDHLDGVAQQHRFADRKALSLRAAYPNAWHDLAVAFGTWMDGCNVQAYTILQEVLAGRQAMPTLEDFIGDLPGFVAP